MGSNQDDSNSKGMCEKILSTLCPNFQSNHHEHHKLRPIPASTAPHTSMPTHVHVKVANVPEAVAASAGMARMHKAEMSTEQRDNRDSTASGWDHNGAFSDYINRTKVKIVAMSSNVGIERIDSRAGETKQEDDSKDVFTDFINRAKFKIRKTSSIGSRRNYSFKK